MRGELGVLSSGGRGGNLEMVKGMESEGEEKVRQRAEGFVGVERWEIRDNGVGHGEDEVGGGMEMDVDDASQVAVLKAKSHDQTAKQRDKMDELADRLRDANVGQIDGMSIWMGCWTVWRVFERLRGVGRRQSAQRGRATSPIVPCKQHNRRNLSYR